MTSVVSMVKLYCVAVVCNLLILSMASRPYGSEGLSVFTKDEIAKHPLLLLSICGNVFNVTSGERFYGTGGPYESFGRKDATRGLALGDFTPENLIDDVSGFSGDECIAVEGWLNFFHDEKSYHHLGVVNGFFYSHAGEETESHQRYKQCLSEGHKSRKGSETSNDSNRSEEDRPECNRIVREVDEFHVVSCERGYTPRKSYFTAGHSVNTDGMSRNIRIITCFCLHLEELNDRQDLELYNENCDPSGTDCAFDNHEFDIHH